MSKSLGNMVTIRQVTAKHSGDAVRIFILSSHYRSPLTYSEETLEAAESGADRLRQVAAIVPDGKGDANIDLDAYRSRFNQAMDDDFNTPQAISAVFDLARDINRERDAGHDITAAKSVFTKLSGILGLTLQSTESQATDAAPFIELLIDTRKGLRQAKQFQLADEIRKKLTDLGCNSGRHPPGHFGKRNR